MSADQARFRWYCKHSCGKSFSSVDAVLNHEQKCIKNPEKGK